MLQENRNVMNLLKKVSLLGLPIMILLLVFLKSKSWAEWPSGRLAMSMMERMRDMPPSKSEKNKIRKEICPMMGKRPVNGINRKDLPESESRAAELYVQYCSQCHSLPNPKAHSAREWEESFKRMDARMQMRGRRKMMRMCRMMNIEVPDDAEKEIILAYLQKHALKAIKEETLPAPKSKGALLFKNICSQCHDLPDPKNYTAEEWPRIVARMENIIREQKGSSILSKKDKELIVQYLQANSSVKVSEGKSIISLYPSLSSLGQE